MYVTLHSLQSNASQSTHTAQTPTRPHALAPSRPHVNHLNRPHAHLSAHPPTHSKVMTWNEGDKIIKQGQVGKEFYIIKSGTTIVTINQAPDSTMTHETLAIAELKQVSEFYEFCVLYEFCEFCEYCELCEFCEFCGLCHLIQGVTCVAHAAHVAHVACVAPPNRLYQTYAG